MKKGSRKKPRVYETELAASFDLVLKEAEADVQRLIEQHHLTLDFAKHLHPYVREKFLELLLC